MKYFYCRICGEYSEIKSKKTILVCKECKEKLKTEKEKIWKKIFYKEIPESADRRNRKYKNTPKGKIAVSKITSKRKRGLGFVSLNSPFENSEGHHINLNDVIYVPYEWNHMIAHNVWTGENMEIVNSMTYFFLMQQNIKEIGEIFK